MDSKYHLLPRRDKEDHIGPITALDQRDNFGIISRDSIITYKSKWLWLLHTIMFSISLTLFTLSVTVRSSTLKHVQEFSAWCMFTIKP